MKALFLGIIIAVTASGTSLAVAEPWTAAADVNLTLTENTYSDSWVGREVGAISWTFNSNSLAKKQLHPRIHNENTLKLSFGQIHNQERKLKAKAWAKPSKSTDLIDLESVFRLTIGGFVEPFAAGRVETQFYDNSDPDKSRYVNPVTFTESLGGAKVLLGEEKRIWNARLGGGLRQHLDRDVLNPQTGKRETKTSSDGGFVLVTDFKTPLAQERITLTSKLTIFQAIFFSESDKLKGQPNEDYWKEPDVNFENIFTASITKYLMVNLYLQLLYDKEINLATRFKQTLALGVSYKII